MTDSTRTLVMIPTYQERENIGLILDRLHAAFPQAHALVVDDGSPDGTADLAEQRASVDPRVHVLRRTQKQGLGAAYIAAMRWGLERGYDVLVEMDADGSHPPETLPAMVAALDGPGRPGLVIGSRWVDGGSVVDWPKSREALSRAGNGYARLALGISVHDATAGFRAYRAELLRRIPLDDIVSHGYCFQVDMTLRVLDAGATIEEVPIQFREREYGESKMSRSIVIEAMLKVTQWGFERRILRRSR
ncbi:polyprenol monophosphomannose synthase [Labedella endophytica]|uniref:Polyprenol monophosphomannose synthase n=1 Tax=Labedella endophytica TaxID=1523160 RepID=A0A433JUL6_9MICO|nr:polyprenol monophosphomannose synthase [Labedella endophytica]RUR01920.1 polyprenol monophosphomannose synthase [Labedella endophytica]